MNTAVPPPSNAPPAPQPSTSPLPATTTQAPPVVLTTANASAGTVIQLPPNLNTLAVGLQLEGLVTERPNPGQILLETRSGSLSVQTALSPAIGTRLILQVTLGGPQPTVLIAPQPEGAPANTPPPPAIRPQAAANPAQPTNPNLASAPSSPAISSFAGVSDSNAQIRGSVVTATVLRTTASPDAAQRTAAMPGVIQTSRTILSHGDRLTVRVAAISRPGTSAPPATPGANSMTGTVTRTDISGQAIVRTNTAELSIAIPRPLPAGSNLLLETLGRPIPFSLPAAGPRDLTLASRWETLHDALRAGSAISAQNAISQAIPQPGTPMTNSLLFFIAALRAGDLRGWLGQDASRLVEREGLLGRMADEFGIMQRLASEPSGQDWRLYLLPLLSDEQLRQIRLFIRDKKDGDQGSKEAKETRFVIEVTFSKLGQFQFDGLARPKALDLIIRTKTDIDTSMRQSITDIFADTTSALGMNGSVGFRTEPFFELQPLRDSGLINNEGVFA